MESKKKVNKFAASNKDPRKTRVLEDSDSGSETDSPVKKPKIAFDKIANYVDDDSDDEDVMVGGFSQIKSKF